MHKKKKCVARDSEYIPGVTAQSHRIQLSRLPNNYKTASLFCLCVCVCVCCDTVHPNENAIASYTSQEVFHFQKRRTESPGWSCGGAHKGTLVALLKSEHGNEPSTEEPVNADASRFLATRGKSSSSPLTFFQSPLDRTRSLADGVQVSVQCGHKEQAFSQGYGAGSAETLQDMSTRTRDF